MFNLRQFNSTIRRCFNDLYRAIHVYELNNLNHLQQRDIVVEREKILSVRSMILQLKLIR